MTKSPSIAGAQDLRLARLSVAVVGAGRIGVELIRNLGLMGLGRIDVYERDRHRADPLRNRYRVHTGDFWDELTLGRLRDYDFAVCTVDDRTARVRMNQKCLVANVNLVHAWTEDAVASVAAYPFGALDDCACYECDESRAARPMPLASLRLTVGGTETSAGPASRIATASIAGALASALLARIAAGAHGAVARRASLDTTSGDGTSVELPRDPKCPRCGALQRPVPIVLTRNRWEVSKCVRAASPGTLAQHVQLSDDLDGLARRSFSVGELAERYQGGPIPAKFALTIVEGRTVCLDFEDLRTDPPRARSSRWPPS